MKRILEHLDKVFHLIYRLSVILAEVTLVAMVLIIGTNVFMRYVLNSGLKWGEEISLVLVIWFSFIAMAIGVRKNLHISIHLFRRSVPMLDLILDKLKALVAVFVGGVIFVYGNVILQFMSRSILPATQLPSSVMYAILPLSSGLIIYEGITDLIGYDTTKSDHDEEEEADHA